MTSAQCSRFLLYIAAIATIAIYWRGLSGPFILDDAYNLHPLQQWLDGEASAAELILGNSSGMLGRPVSMATLLFTTATGGMHPFPFKFGNLLVHLSSGFVAWAMLRTILAEDPHLKYRAPIVSALLVSLWLLHPMLVSTVLYAVQRMAQMGALFVLISIWIYASARRNQLDGQVAQANRKLFLIFPLAFAAGLLSKENAVVAPGICLVLELAYYSRQQKPRSTLLWFFGIFLLLPILAGVALAAYQPDRILGLYATRDFSLGQRLLSQPRALWEYIGLTFWPRGGLMGVYVDDFSASTGLVSPPSTLVSILGLIGVSAIAIRARKRAPSVFAGWFFFLVAHGVESSFLPLELYFEHRNYLPMFGLLLAAAGALNFVARCIRLQGKTAWIAASLFCAGFLSACLATTSRQVEVWQSVDGIVRQALENRPTSLRAQLEGASLSVHAGDWEAAREAMQKLTRSPDPSHQSTGHISLLVLECLQYSAGQASHLKRASEVGLERVTLTEVLTFRPLSKALAEGRCGTEITHSSVAETIVGILEGARHQPDTSKPKWLLRTLAAELYMRDGRMPQALNQAQLAWQKNADPGIGALLTRLYIHTGNRDAAQRTWNEVNAKTHSYELIANRELSKIRGQIEAMPN